MNGRSSPHSEHPKLKTRFWNRAECATYVSDAPFASPSHTTIILTVNLTQYCVTRVKNLCARQQSRASIEVRGSICSRKHQIIFWKHLIWNESLSWNFHKVLKIGIGIIVWKCWCKIMWEAPRPNHWIVWERHHSPAIQTYFKCMDSSSTLDHKSQDWMNIHLIHAREKLLFIFYTHTHTGKTNQCFPHSRGSHAYIWRWVLVINVIIKLKTIKSLIKTTKTDNIVFKKESRSSS